VPLPPPPQYYDQHGNPVPSAAAAPPPPPPTLPSASAGGVTRTKAERKTGRNRDADSISNTADIYFAQLKRDSTVRTAARQAGDLDTANQAMAHPDIEKMKDLVNKNPYLNAFHEATFPPTFKRSAAFFTQQSAKIHRKAISSNSWQYQQQQIVDFS